MLDSIVIVMAIVSSFLSGFTAVLSTIKNIKLKKERGKQPLVYRETKNSGNGHDLIDGEKNIKYFEKIG